MRITWHDPRKSVIESPQSDARVDANCLFLRVDAKAFHPRKVHHQAVLADGRPRHGMAVALDGQPEVPFSGKFNARNDVTRIHALRDEPCPAVDSAIPDPPRPLVTTVGPVNDLLAQSFCKGGYKGRIFCSNCSRWHP